MSRTKVHGRSVSSAQESANAKKKFLTRKHWFLIGAVAFASLLVVGVFAENGWLPSKKTSWFGKPLAKSSSWNPLAAPLPTPTPSLRTEYVYAAGGRLLAQVDANAQEAPPADLAVWRPSTGGWWVLGSQWTQQVNQNWGSMGDDPVEGDYS